MAPKRLISWPGAKGRMKTSVDVVSEDSDRYHRVVTPALQYADYCIVNEIEAGRTAGFKVRETMAASIPSHCVTRQALCSSMASRSWWSFIFPKAHSLGPGKGRIIGNRLSMSRPSRSRERPAPGMPSVRACSWGYTKVGLCPVAC